MIVGEIKNESRTKAKNGEGTFSDGTALKRPLALETSLTASSSTSGSKSNDWLPKEGGPGNEIRMRELGLLVRGHEIRGRRDESNTWNE